MEAAVPSAKKTASSSEIIWRGAISRVILWRMNRRGTRQWTSKSSWITPQKQQRLVTRNSRGIEVTIWAWAITYQQVPLVLGRAVLGVHKASWISTIISRRSSRRQNRKSGKFAIHLTWNCKGLKTSNPWNSSDIRAARSCISLLRSHLSCTPTAWESSTTRTQIIKRCWKIDTFRITTQNTRWA